MFRADYHCHSSFSPDGTDSIETLLAAAEERGLSELCVTDHCDLTAPPELAPYARAVEEARRVYRGPVRLLFGLELGDTPGYPEVARHIERAYDWDFIIGSLHQMRGYEDFYYLRYPSEEACHEMLALYFAELTEMAALGVFDVLGHLSYPLRYMCGREGYRIALEERYERELRRLFRLLRESGKGLELNLSGLYKPEGGGESMPSAAVLRLYRDCGGEIVTLGSDAHCAGDVGGAWEQGCALCRGAGFTQIAAYQGRKLRYEAI